MEVSSVDIQESHGQIRLMNIIAPVSADQDLEDSAVIDESCIHETWVGPAILVDTSVSWKTQLQWNPSRY